MSQDDAVERARRVVRVEREALEALERRIDGTFSAALDVLAGATGKILVTGVGKSGIVARKIAATFTSTGTPAVFLHPVDSAHGDIGIAAPGDAAIFISKSGEADELLAPLDYLEEIGVPTIAITGGADSALARQARVVLDASVREEACPHDLAPTASTTVALAIGDALAVALLERKGFDREDFARLHPSGTLGRRLATRVDRIMLRTDLPILRHGASMRDAIMMIAERRGIAIIADADGRVEGLLTAGDLSRLVEHNDRVFDVDPASAMTRSPKVAQADDLAATILHQMEQFGIMAMPVVDADHRMIGVVHLHDLMRARLGAMRRLAPAVALIAMIVAVACTHAPAPPPIAKPDASDSADQVLYNVRSPITSQGVIRGVMFADTVYVLDNQTRYDCRVGRMDFNSPTGEPQGSMHADRCRYDVRRQILEGWGHVVVAMVDGRVLRSPHVRYDRLRDSITSDTNYTISRGNSQGQWGVGFVTDSALNHFVCLRDCAGTLPVAIPPL